MGFYVSKSSCWMLGKCQVDTKSSSQNRFEKYSTFTERQDMHLQSPMCARFPVAALACANGVNHEQLLASLLSSIVWLIFRTPKSWIWKWHQTQRVPLYLKVRVVAP